MGLKQEQVQQQTQHLTAQQVHLLKLVALPSHAVDSYVEEVLDENPALEEDLKYEAENLAEEAPSSSSSPSGTTGHAPLEWVEHNLRSQVDRQTHLLEQLHFLELNTLEQRMGEQIIGSLDDSGYLRRSLQALANDLLINEGLVVTITDLGGILERIQRFDPPGIASRSLQECLLRQLEHQSSNSAVILAQKIIEKYYESLVHKHHHKLQERLKVSKEELQEALGVIKRLTPRPGGIDKQSNHAVVVADFSAQITPTEVVVRVLRKPRRWARVSSSYKRWYKQLYENKPATTASKAAQLFVRKQVEAAESFVQALQQREATLLKVVQLIANYQRAFLESGDLLHLKPLILKDIAEQVGMDISTISRIVNRKYLQTPAGVLSLRKFFSQAHKGNTKQIISNAHIKEVVRTAIDAENKQTPLSDEALVQQLQQQGYTVARRTVAKYREQLHIPVARLRKEIP